MSTTFAPEPWVRYGETELYAVPSAHNRIVFAQLVVAACTRRPFDVIAVELPASYGDDGTIDLIRRIAPAVGMVVEERARGRSLFVPVTPADSIITALRCPTLLRNRWPDWHPDIVAVDAEHRDVNRTLGPWAATDDYEAWISGPAAFCRRWESSWPAARDERIDGWREQVMAARLRRFLSAGKSVLFVCGAAHWAPIVAVLDAGPTKVPRAEERRRTRQPRPKRHGAALDPALAWLWGWLDDIPRLVEEFEAACQAQRGDRFDKVAAEKLVLESAMGEVIGQGHRVSPRALLKMVQLQQSLRGLEGRWTSMLDPHIIDPATSCVTTDFGRALKRALLSFKQDVPPGIPIASFAVTDGGHIVLDIGEQRIRVRPARGPLEAGGRLPLPLPLSLTPGESRQRDQARIYRDWPPEALLHNRLIRRAREVAHGKPTSEVVRPSSGDLGLGPDWRRTIRRMAAGADALYVRHRSRRRPLTPSSCDGLCPVVWIFDIAKPAIDRFAGYVPRALNSSTPRCHSAFYWLSGREHLGDSGITQLRVCYTVSLLRGLMPTHQRRTEAAIEALVARFPPERRPIVHPWSDTTLQCFTGYEQAIACGIRYAGDHVILVSIPPVRLSNEVNDFAARRGVHILRVSADCFDRSALERLALDHNVPAPSHDMEPFPWCTRYIPTV